MNEQARWQAVLERDAQQDGRFYYGVVTTGVYCRPSCASRRPLRRNVRFFDTPAAAQADGMRPCKRCKPLQQRADSRTVERIEALCRHLEQHLDDAPNLDALAVRVHLSPFHLQRQFKAVLGLSPKQYVDALRLRALRQGLRDGAPVTRAIQDAGYGSSSRVYEKLATHLGMTPKQYRSGGRDVAISYASGDTSLGQVMIGATDRGLCFVQFADNELELIDRLRSEYPGAELAPMDAQHAPQFDDWMQALRRHLETGAPASVLPLDLRGTAFQMKVWNYLCRIPSGEVRAYAEVAEAIGHPRAVRAVASACAANRVALLVPCHRVIRGDGGLGGYKWGIERKRALLDQERAQRSGRSAKP
ncbi:bifunctional DNA-binding transcriptional regulator/O6-methylguanine-DNA methyltransferase Ada [Sinimarinibacterium sp. CAU 1509]|uniref:bifunctional DNA-binding transcriptional regulator/O6-methylguanine-DNA methyltransferase Ada n=1 Tax=Sinimarinibacterium sp. CAU 1509 TaxID=2562283 RepID=UPI0010ABFD4E|nr:bifunctional DNA-binding transcriptional regulator/O6-methylguanine-DNA methyltransferase Ada [Sinimarinibacterium sp. CAU 1509]TJY58833.1 bifunctional DNA-binding transcriptional regulator/O6-methylguanine-DNA methyltransferase Ada [Sinimarinibacterium sp. CAU 1509]